MKTTDAYFDRLARNWRDISPVLRAFHAYMVRQTDLMFEKAGGPGSAVAGGEYRGVTWPGFASQYTRKDGTEVPAWGGVPRADGKGSVKPRLRPSGQPVTPASLLVQDTGRLRQRAASEVLEITPFSLAFGTRLWNLRFKPATLGARLL